MSIVESLNEKSDSFLIERCYHFFLEHQNYEKAVNLMIKVGNHLRAIELTSNFDMPMTEALADQLTPVSVVEKCFSNSPSEELRQTYKDGLLKLADLCLRQAQYHLACKKYTQAGDKLLAMRALIRSEDVDKIIYFAGNDDKAVIRSAFITLSGFYITRIIGSNK